MGKTLIKLMYDLQSVILGMGGAHTVEEYQSLHHLVRASEPDFQHAPALHAVEATRAIPNAAAALRNDGTLNEPGPSRQMNAYGPGITAANDPHNFKSLRRVTEVPRLGLKARVAKRNGAVEPSAEVFLINLLAAKDAKLQHKSEELKEKNEELKYKSKELDEKTEEQEYQREALTSALEKLRRIQAAFTKVKTDLQSCKAKKVKVLTKKATFAKRSAAIFAKQRAMLEAQGGDGPPFGAGNWGIRVPISGTSRRLSSKRMPLLMFF